MALIFKERGAMLLHCTTLIIKASSINLNYGSMEKFCDEFNLNGLSNGQLFIVYDMMEPSTYFDELIEDVLTPSGMRYNIDYLILNEQITQGVIGRENSEESLINKPIPLSEHADWIGSIIKEDGQYIWLL